MRRAIGWDHAEQVRVFVQGSPRGRGLARFPHWIRDEVCSGDARGAASGVLPGIVGPSDDFEFLGAFLERRRDGVVLAAHLHAAKVERAGIVDSERSGLPSAMRGVGFGAAALQRAWRPEARSVVPATVP